MRSYNNYDFFVYETDFSGLAAAASASNSFTVQQEADFILTKINVTADIAGGAITESTRIIPLVTVLINDTGSGRNLMSQAIPIPNLFGSGGLPFILPRQRIFVASSVVNVTVSNYSAGTTYNLRLSFIGEKAFTYGGQ